MEHNRSTPALESAGCGTNIESDAHDLERLHLDPHRPLSLRRPPGEPVIESRR